MKKEYILFIDSGTGGLSTLCEVYKMISANFIYFADNKNCPYGSHKKNEIFGFLKGIIDKVRSKYNVKLVVLACNTATTSSIFKLRRTYPGLTIVGTEPAIKLAETLGFKNILMISTPVTAKQKKFKSLKLSLNSKVVALKMPTFAKDIENYLAETVIHDETALARLLCGKNATEKGDYARPESRFFDTEVYRSLGPNLLFRLRLLQDLLLIRQKSKEHDCVVLGCTHYSLISNNIIRDFSCRPLISGNFGVAKEILRHFSCQNSTFGSPKLIFMFSKPSKNLKQIYKKIFMQILANN